MEIKLLVGLGNPGREFKGTYHNVGQFFIDELAGQAAEFKKEKYFIYEKSQKPESGSRELILIKTLTFMNQSGGAVLAAKKYFNSRPSELLVIHDDSDIPLGSFKLSFARGSAGHQGIESIIKSLRTNRFYRLRIGVRPSQEAGLPAGTRRSSPSLKLRRVKAGDLVLKKIPQREIKILKDLFREVGLQYLKMDGKAYPAAGFRQDA